jgi:two-component system cell cycle response regulator
MRRKTHESACLTFYHEAAVSFDALKDLLILLQLTEQLTDSGRRPLEDALRAVTDATLSILPGDHASIRLVDASRTHLLASARSGTGYDAPAVPFAIGKGISGWVLIHGEPARIVDVRKDERYVPHPSQGFAIRSMVVEPLMSEGAPIGVLSVSSPEVNAFSQTDELLARLLANCSVAPTFNARYLATRLVEEIERSRRSGTPLSLLWMDLDHFKRVNDKHGHAAGDQVLRAFADRVRAATRRVDILVRRGGEEFVLIMPSTSGAQAKTIAERVRATVGDTPIPVADGGRVTQTVSIGVVTWNGREAPDGLQQRADETMYFAKQRGRNRVESSPDRRRKPASRVTARRATRSNGTRSNSRDT